MIIDSPTGISNVTYFTPVWYRQFLGFLLSILTLGLFYVCTYIYNRQVWVKLTCRKSLLRGDAKYVLARDTDNDFAVVRLHLMSHDGLSVKVSSTPIKSKINPSFRKKRETTQRDVNVDIFESKYLSPCFTLGKDILAWDYTKKAFFPIAEKPWGTNETSIHNDHNDPDVKVINEGKDDQMSCHGFKKIKLMEYAVILGYFLSVGILWLVFYWKPEWRLAVTHEKCPLYSADCILMTDLYKRSWVKTVQFVSRDGIKVKPLDSERSCQYFTSRPGAQAAILRFITVQKLRYFWSPERQQFEKFQGLLGEDPTFASIHQFKGLTCEESADRRVLAGPNSINVRITPVLVIVVREILSPFYMFQIFSCILWFLDEYVTYASTIAFLSAASVIWTVYLTRHTEKALRKTVHTAQPVTVLRPDGSHEDIMPDSLSPGDVIIIPKQGTVLQCDAVLQTGNCIVNEAMLTGESVPVTKTALPLVKKPSDDQPLHVKLHERHILFCGTRVIQTKYFKNKDVKAVVLSTGFMTAKGDLIRSILFPKPLDFRFMVDAMKFVGLLAIIALIGLVYSLVLRVERDEHWSTIVVRCLDLVTIVVPPALPIALSVGYATAQTRLKKSKIFCVSPSTINVCGVIDVVCFDKTGTLTEDGLDFSRVVPCERSLFQPPVTNGAYIEPKSSLATCMATCHSLARIEGEITGDPIDLKMFQVTNWELEEPSGDSDQYEVLTPTIVRPRRSGTSPEFNSTDDVDQQLPFEVGIIRQYPFSSSLQRMSVITRVLGEKYFALYLKGAPEVVVSLCQPHTVPNDFSEELIQYTQQGYRVLGLAWKPLPGMSYAKTQRVERQYVEHGLEFIGLLVMENRLKPETTPVIARLRDANMRCLMVTGL